MANQVIINKAWSLQLRDVLKSWVMAVVFPVVTATIELIQAQGNFDGINWNKIGISTLVATLLFLAQRFGAPAKVVTTYDSNAQAESVAKDVAMQTGNQVKGL